MIVLTQSDLQHLIEGGVLEIPGRIEAKVFGFPQKPQRVDVQIRLDSNLVSNARVQSLFTDEVESQST